MPVPLAAERYGLKADRDGLVCCPFHDDHAASLRLNDSFFYCSGCGAGGSVVDLTARLFDLRPYEAAQKLAEDFDVDVPATAQPDGSLERFRADLLRCQWLLEEYLDVLLCWKNRYRPQAGDWDVDERYAEACQMVEYVDYLADVLAAGTLEQRIRTVERLMADGKMDRLEEQLKQIEEENE